MTPVKDLGWDPQVENHWYRLTSYTFHGFRVNTPVFKYYLDNLKSKFQGQLWLQNINFPYAKDFYSNKSLVTATLTTSSELSIIPSNNNDFLLDWNIATEYAQHWSCNFFWIGENKTKDGKTLWKKYIVKSLLAPQTWHRHLQSSKQTWHPQCSDDCANLLP